MSDAQRPGTQHSPADPYRPSADQHDTTAFVRPAAGQQPTGAGYGPPQHGWYVPGQQPDPAAAHWEARYRRQRTLTAVLGVGVGLSLVAMVGLGVAAWQLARSNPLTSAVSALAGGQGDLEQLLPEGDVPLDELLPGSPEAPGNGPADDAPEAQGTLPLPEPLQELGSAFGITDVADLLALAEANGLLSEEDADDLRAAIEGGAALSDLFGAGTEG